MNEKKLSEMTYNVISGMSSTVGASAGVVAGTMISSKVNAAEAPETPYEEQGVEVVSSQPSRTSGSTTHLNHVPVAEPSPDPIPQPSPTPEPGPTPDPDPEPIPEPEIEVVSYETVTSEDGTPMDVAVVNAQGQAVIIADVDQNGYADVMASDLNNNGLLEEGEILDVSNQNIAMQPLQAAANMGGNNMIAQTDDVDYINDANVDDYMA